MYANNDEPHPPAGESEVHKRRLSERISRNQIQLDSEFGAMDEASTFKALTESLRQSCASCPGRLPSILISFVPILQWLPQYNIGENLIHDVVGGLTVGIMNVPQCMAYALLVGVDPIYGLYTSLYSALIYIFFTTSRHNSMGTSAVVAIMVGNTIGQAYHNIQQDQMHRHKYLDHLLSNDSLADFEESINVSRIEVAVALTLCVALIQLAMAILRLDFLMAYLSDEVIRGFMTAVGFHVLASQLSKVFGVKTKKYEGFGKVIRTTADILSQLPNANVATTATSIVTIVVLFICKSIIASRVKKYVRFPIPFDFFVLVFGILLSYFLHAEERWGMKVIGEIPTGLPALTVPRLDLIPYVLGNAPAVAIVVIAIEVLLGKLFAQRNNYPVDVPQEFYATALTELALSFFPSWTCSVALSRSLVNESAGTKTQLSAVFSSSVLLLVIFIFGRFMNDLPLCLLACIIIVALKGMFVQFADLKHLWKLSAFDFAIWMVTFIVTLVGNIVEGLLAGVIFALLTVIWRAQRLEISEVGRLSTESGTTYYRTLEHYRDCCYIHNVICLQISGPIIFLNIDRVRKACMRIIDNRLEESSKKGGNKGQHHVIQVWSLTIQGTLPYNLSGGDFNEKKDSEFGHKIAPARFTHKEEPVKHLIVDLSAVPYIDVMGANLLKEIYLTTKEYSIATSYTCATRQVFDLIRRCGFLEKLPLCAFYPSIDDALQSVHVSIK